MNKQEAVDRLVNAVEETDTLYELIWINTMKAAGMVKEGLQAKREYRSTLSSLGFLRLPRRLFAVRRLVERSICPR
jgi:hypothetical protein